MSLASHPPTWTEIRHEASSLGGNWGWFVALGVILIILGLLALGAVGVASLATAMFVGWLMLIGGLIDIAGSFWSRVGDGLVPPNQPDLPGSRLDRHRRGHPRPAPRRR